MKHMSVTSVIINYHTTRLVRNLLKDLCQSSAIERIIVVDNSKDFSLHAPDQNSSSAIEGLSCNHEERVIPVDGRIEVITPEKNIGFGAGVNLAAESIESEWILVVNPDMRVPSGSVEHLVAGARSTGALLAGPRFYWDDEKRFRLPPALGASSWLDYAMMSQSFHELDAHHLSFYWQIRHDRFWSSTTPFVEPFLSGACMLINRKWAISCHDNLIPDKNNKKKSSVFDPRFFMYYEDTDLAVAACRDGVPPVCIPDSEMIHYYNQSPDPGVAKSRMMEESHTHFKKKHYPSLSFNIDCENRYTPEYTDLKEIDSSYAFQATHSGAGSCDVHSGPLFFEIGVTHFFVPFVQSPLDNKPDQTVHLSERFWNRLVPGEYFARFRSPFKGIQNIWKWKKN